MAWGGWNFLLWLRVAVLRAMQSLNVIGSHGPHLLFWTQKENSPLLATGGALGSAPRLSLVLFLPTGLYCLGCLRQGMSKTQRNSVSLIYLELAAQKPGKSQTCLTIVTVVSLFLILLLVFKQDLHICTILFLVFFVCTRNQGQVLTVKEWFHQL